MLPAVPVVRALPAPRPGRLAFPVCRRVQIQQQLPGPAGLSSDLRVRIPV
ncbi:MAG: hypothetical protein ACK55I_11000 [bacterium]